ncbi:unnamed protein product [Pleuronectes platessa]|uniref:Uncharacterized protein n=1 Tax=Pleuronectes platessa TaxID=8262 RepID=A0A9N7YG87_PLEPL|nr:unnamed protein product [Pleuronectes platessa]
MQREQAVFNRQFLGMLQSQMEHLFAQPTASPGPAGRSPLAVPSRYKQRSQPAGGALNAWAGVLEVRAAWALPGGVSSHGSGTSDPG